MQHFWRRMKVRNGPPVTGSGVSLVRIAELPLGSSAGINLRDHRNARVVDFDSHLGSFLNVLIANRHHVTKVYV